MPHNAQSYYYPILQMWKVRLTGFMCDLRIDLHSLACWDQTLDLLGLTQAHFPMYPMRMVVDSLQVLTLGVFKVSLIMLLFLQSVFLS